MKTYLAPVHNGRIGTEFTIEVDRIEDGKATGKIADAPPGTLAAMLTCEYMVEDCIYAEQIQPRHYRPDWETTIKNVTRHGEATQLHAVLSGFQPHPMSPRVSALIKAVQYISEPERARLAQLAWEQMGIIGRVRNGIACTGEDLPERIKAAVWEHVQDAA